jgi:hypothetical protein
MYAKRFLVLSRFQRHGKCRPANRLLELENLAHWIRFYGIVVLLPLEEEEAPHRLQCARLALIGASQLFSFVICEFMAPCVFLAEIEAKAVEPGRRSSAFRIPRASTYESS